MSSSGTGLEDVNNSLKTIPTESGPKLPMARHKHEIDVGPASVYVPAKTGPVSVIDAFDRDIVAELKMKLPVMVSVPGG